MRKEIIEEVVEVQNDAKNQNHSNNSKESELYDSEMHLEKDLLFCADLYK
jgi:hypothetical protein